MGFTSLYYVVLQDKLHESFVKTGDFFATSGVKRLEPFELSKRAYSLMNMCVWSIVTLCPMIYYLIKLLFSGELLYFSMGAGIISICKYIHTMLSTPSYKAIECSEILPHINLIELVYEEVNSIYLLGDSFTEYYKCNLVSNLIYNVPLMLNAAC